MAKGVSKKPGFSSLMDDLTPASTHTHAHTHEDEYVQPKAIKDRRVHLLLQSAFVDRMDAEAKRRGMSRAELIEAAVTQYLK